VNGVSNYTQIPTESWASKFLEKVKNSNIEFSTAIEFENNDWAIERNENITAISPVNGKQVPGMARIKPEYEEEYKKFINYYYEIMPNLKYIQIDDEAENAWVDGEGYNRILELTKESIRENDLNLQVMAAGFNFSAEMTKIPMELQIEIKNTFPNIDEQKIRESLNVPDDFSSKQIMYLAQKIHVLLTVLMREDPQFDILTIHYDGPRLYETIESAIQWYKDIMNSYGYEKPIWIDDMHSTYYPEVKAESELDIMLNGGLMAGDAEAIKIQEELGPTYLVRKTVGYFAAGAERVKIAYGMDFEDYYLPAWKYSGLFTSDFKPKPTYFTAKEMIAKIDGFKTAERLGKEYLYKFTFENKGNVYVAWSEEGAKTIDLSKEFNSGEVRITHIVTELKSNKEPIYPEDEIVPKGKVLISEIPIFIEEKE